ncbi:MAG: hypothetical protein ACOCRU_00380 [bacterium]
MIKTFNRVIILLSLILFLFTVNLLAYESAFQENWNNQNWEKTPGEVIIYSIEFHEINKEFIENSPLSVYISDSSGDNLEIGYRTYDSYITLLQEDSSSIDTLNYILDDQKRFQSYFLTIEDRLVEFAIGEKYFNLDPTRENQFLLDLSLKAEMIDYDQKKILTEIKFNHTSEQTINNMETISWVSNKINEPIAILNRRSLASGKEENRFFLIYLAAKVIAGDKINDLNRIIKITDITQVADIFRKDHIQNSIKNRIKSQLSRENLSLKFSHDRGDSDYSLQITKNFLETGFIYSLNGGIGLYPEEGLFFRTSISNDTLLSEKDRSYLPVIRFGLSDSISWSDRYRFTISYYPLVISTVGEVDNNLINFALAYQKGRWKASYKIDFISGENLQRLSLGHIFDDNKELSLNYIDDFFSKKNITIAVEFPFKLEGDR